jgi:hypothetical protein
MSKVLIQELESGNLQTTLFIQTVIGLFERMEKLLGLPVDFRISPYGCEHRGLLSQGYFPSILTAVLRQEEEGIGQLAHAKRGLGGMKALRESMEKAKQLLRNNIAP